MAETEAKVSELKSAGNDFFASKKYKEAAVLYTRALKLIADANAPDKPALLSNRSACLSQLAKFEAALKDAEACIACSPQWVKGHYRKVKALEGLHRQGELQTALLVALSLEPKNPDMLAMLKTHFPAEAKKFKEDQEALQMASQFLPTPVLKWSQQVLTEIKAGFASKTFQTIAYLLPKGDGEHIDVACKEAFLNEELGLRCKEFLSGLVEKENCCAVLLAVRLSEINHPQLWLNQPKSKFPFDPKADGCFVQLESLSGEDVSRSVFFVPALPDGKLYDTPFMCEPTEEFLFLGPIIKR